MTILTEGVHAGEFLVSEANKTLSREQITVLSGQNLLAGAVIGLVKGASAAAPNPTVAGTGNGTMTKVKPGPDGQTGNYVVTCTAAVTNGGVFSVVAPSGLALPNFTLTPGSGGVSNYTSSHISFSITDGSTDFVVADAFTIAVTAGGTPAVVGTGNGVMSAISMGGAATNGTYRIQCITATANGGTFSVVAPDGHRLADLVLTAGSGATTAYASDHVNFSITDGSTDFVVGDYFHLVIAAGSKKVAAFTPAAVNGTEDAAGILFDAVNATTGDADGVIIVRDAEVNWSELSWGATVSAADKAAVRTALEALGIVGR